MQINERVTNDDEHKLAMGRLDQLMIHCANDDEVAELTALAKAIQAYERERWPIDPPDAVDAVEFELDRHLATLDGLTDIFGSRERLADFMTRRIRADADEMQQLHESYNIEMAVLQRPHRAGEGWYPILEGHLPWRQELKDSVLVAA